MPPLTDREKFLALMRDFEIEPEQKETTRKHPVISLIAEEGGVQGYSGFTTDFEFDEEGKFVSVHVWE